MAWGQTTLFERFRSADGLEASQLHDVAVDAWGDVFVSGDREIFRFVGLGFERVPVVPESGSEFVGFQLCSNGIFAAYTIENQIYTMQSGVFRPYSPSMPEMKGLINQIAADTAGNLLISFILPGGLVVADRTGSHLHESVTSSTGFYILNQASGLICGAGPAAQQSKKLQLIEGKSQVEIAQTAITDASRSRVIKSKNRIYYSRQQEVLQIERNRVFSRMFTQKAISDMHLDQNGALWLALVQGGVDCYPEGKLTETNANHYLSNLSITGIAEDGAGNLWFSSQTEGLFLLPQMPRSSYSAPERFSATKPGQIETILGATTRQTQFELADVPVLKYVSTENVQRDTMPPVVFISGVRILNVDTTLHPEYQLSYFENYIRISFIGQSFLAKQLPQYKYRMHGIEDDWTYTNSSFAQYTTMPPGEYRFEVYAMNNEGIWSDFPAVVTFQIAPPFWTTWWFIGSLLITTTSLIVFLIWLRIRHIKEREREQVRIAKEIAGLESQALRAQMNPHFIFNTLSSIQAFITGNKTEDALKYLSKFSSLMRKIMENSRRDVVTIQDEIDALKLYLELESLRFNHAITWNVHLDPEIDCSFEEIPPMLIQPYVENAILHGIRHREQGGDIQISLVKSGSHIRCTISDNGVGRKRSAEINSVRTHHHHSAAMDITKHRLEILNRGKDLELRVVISDLYQADGSPAGTQVVINIPL